MIKKIHQNFKVYGLSGFLGNLFWEIRMRYRWYYLKSFSQGGEDIILDKILGQKRTGFYVDVGAFDPTRFSNTKRFYLKGWRGINIEPDPNRYKFFQQIRKRDTNLNFGIANKSGILNFYQFNPQTLSTFSKNAANEYRKKGHPLISNSEIKVYKLNTVLEKYAKKKPIDFMSIDTEGFDLEVLKSNNWKRFKPKIICIETVDEESEKLLSKLGYKKVAKTFINTIYKNT